MDMTFERAQALALVQARIMGVPVPLAASSRGLRGKDWFVVAVGHPRWVVDRDMAYLNPDLPQFVVHDDGTVEVHQLPVGPLFEGTVVKGEVLDLDSALRLA